VRIGPKHTSIASRRCRGTFCLKSPHVAVVVSLRRPGLYDNQRRGFPKPVPDKVWLSGQTQKMAASHESGLAGSVAVLSPRHSAGTLL
jgi:hypothetical protein